eukprot:m.1157525 g.1157525  ORF g.1157525 m.1157525 type:complete len:1577 (-) comp24497_c0_seq1:211-4941(-)
MDQEGRMYSRSSRIEPQPYRKRKIERSPERFASRGTDVDQSPSRASHKKSKKEKKKKEKIKKKSKRKSPHKAVLDIKARDRYDSSDHSSNDEVQDISSGIPPSIPSDQIRPRFESSTGNEYRHRDSGDKHARKNHSHDESAGRASAPAVSFSPDHNGDFCRAEDAAADGTPAVVLPHDLDNAPQVVDCLTRPPPSQPSAVKIDSSVNEIVLPLKDQPLTLRARNTVRFGIRLVSRQPILDKQIQWNILQNLEAKMKACPPLSLPLKFERRSNNGQANELEVITEFTENGMATMIDLLHHTTFRVGKCASAVEVTATRVQHAGSRRGASVLDRLDTGARLRPDTSADEGTMRQSGAYTLHLQDIPIRCFKLTGVKGPNNERIERVFSHLGKLVRFQVVHQASSSLNFDLYLQFHDHTEAETAYTALLNRRFVQQLASGREFMADIHVKHDSLQYLSDANITARAEALREALHARELRRKEEERRADEERRHAQEEAEREAQRAQAEAEALEREKARILQQQELEAAEARQKAHEEEQRRALEAQRQQERAQKEAEEAKRREEERKLKQAQEAKRRLDQEQQEAEEKKRKEEEAHQLEIGRQEKIRRDNEKKAAAKQKKDMEDRKRERERQARKLDEHEKRASQQRQHDGQAHRKQDQGRGQSGRADSDTSAANDDRQRRGDRSVSDGRHRGTEQPRRSGDKASQSRSDVGRRVDGGHPEARPREPRTYVETGHVHHDERRGTNSPHHHQRADDSNPAAQERGKSPRMHMESRQRGDDKRLHQHNPSHRSNHSATSHTPIATTQHAADEQERDNTFEATTNEAKSTEATTERPLSRDSRTARDMVDQKVDEAVERQLSEAQKLLTEAEAAKQAAEEKALAAVAASEAATAQFKTDIKARAQAAVKLVRQTESKKTKEAIEKAVTESTAQVEKAREEFRQQLAQEQAARALAEEKAAKLEVERVALRDALAAKKAAAAAAPAAAQPGNSTEAVSSGMGMDVSKVPPTAAKTVPALSTAPAVSSPGASGLTGSAAAPSVAIPDALDAAQIAAVNLALAVTDSSGLLRNGNNSSDAAPPTRSKVEHHVETTAPPPPPPPPEDDTVAPANDGIIQLRQHQRWPQSGEQACVMCGRFAEYESSETGDGVCSIQCKNAQINSIKAGNVHAHVPPPPPLPMLAVVPSDYGMVSTLDHGSAVYSIAMAATVSPRIVYSTGVGNVKHWDVTTPQRNTQPAGSVQPLHVGTNIRCSHAVPGTTGNLLVAGDASTIAVLNGSITAVVYELAHKRFTRGPSSQESLLWPAWVRRKPRTSPSHAKAKKSSPLGGTASPAKKVLSPSSKKLSPTAKVVGNASASPSPPVTPSSPHRSVHYTTLAVSPVQPLCFAGTTDGTVHIWDIHTRELIRVLYGHVGTITGLSLACNARTLVSSAADGTVRVWDLVTCTSKECTFGNGVVAMSLRASPVDTVAMVGCDDGSLWSLDLVSMAKDPIGWHHDCVRSITFARSGEWFVTTGRDPQGKLSLAIVWHRSQRRPLFFLRDFEKTATAEGMLCSAISDDGSVLVTGSSSGVARVYQMRFGAGNTLP